jgi:DNA adenine methylase
MVEKDDMAIPYVGGKTSHIDKLLTFIPQHQTYVEVFGGSGALLIHKPPSPNEIYNDLDSGLVNYFRVLRDPEKFKRFSEMMDLSPRSREEWEYANENWDKQTDDVMRAFYWAIKFRQSFSGAGWSWQFGIVKSPIKICDWVDQLRRINARLMNVQIEHQDFRFILKHYDSKDVFFYLDPPYLQETRMDKIYANEMSNADHIELLKLLQDIKGMALLSGYDNELYNNELKPPKWQTATWNTWAHSQKAKANKGEGRSPRVEKVWFNYLIGSSLFEGGKNESEERKNH